MDSPGRCGRPTRSARCTSRAACGPGRSRSTRASGSTRPGRSAATSSPASVASSASKGSRSTRRPRSSLYRGRDVADNLKYGLALGYSGATPEDQSDLAIEAERLGYDSVWTAEAYGSDVFTPLAYIGARTSTIKLGTGIAQISARTPAALAMTAATLDHLSGGRLILGLGVSGPQVVEGWYGVPFGKPLARTREYVDIVNKILRREGPVTNDGEHYPLPYPGGTGLGKPLKLTVHPLRDHIPIILAAEGPKNVALSTEIADGWMPIFYSPYTGPEVFADSLKGAKPGFEIPCVVTVTLGESVEDALTMVKFFLAFYIGGMGAPEQ